MNRVIVNISVGDHNSWYHNGQERLLQSLKEVGDSSDLLFTKQYGRVSNPYVEKVRQIRTAVEKGYKNLLWLDCSIKAIGNTDAIWEYINENGYYLYTSGYNCAQSSNDYSLNCYGVNRDEAEAFPECASNVVGINLNSIKGRAFYELWVKSIEDGSMNGVKWPNTQQRLKESEDPRFLFHRQDQTTASLAANLAGCKMEEQGHLVSRVETGITNTTIFTLRGGK